MDAQNHTLQRKVNEVQNHNYGIWQLTCRISPYQKIQFPNKIIPYRSMPLMLKIISER